MKTTTVQHTYVQRGYHDTEWEEFRITRIEGRTTAQLDVMARSNFSFPNIGLNRNDAFALRNVLNEALEDWK